MVAEDNRLKVADQIPMTLILKHENVEQSIVESRILKEHKGTSVQPAISNKHEAALPRSSVYRFNADLWRLSRAT